MYFKLINSTSSSKTVFLIWFFFSLFILQSTIQEFIGKQELDKHLDADEAIVLGSALHAANLSDGIKLKRRLGIVDGSPYGFLVELEGPDVKKDESTKQQLVPRMKKLPSKVQHYIHNLFKLSNV